MFITSRNYISSSTLLLCTEFATVDGLTVDYLLSENYNILKIYCFDEEIIDFKLFIYFY